MFNPTEKLYKYCPTCANLLKRNLIEGKNRLSCNKCGFIFWNNPIPVVSAIIHLDNKILLVKRKHKPLHGYWCLPGGIIDYEEKPEEAIHREVKEETGLNIIIKNLIGVYQVDNDPRAISIDIIYNAQIKGNNNITLSEEHSQYQFYSPNELPELIAYKHRQAIDDWQKQK